MNPIDFKESNLNLQAGNNPGTEDMRVCIAANKEMTEGKNIVFAVSAWKPTEEELAEINRTGIIYQSVMGWPVPPTSLLAFNLAPHEACSICL